MLLGVAPAGGQRPLRSPVFRDGAVHVGGGRGLHAAGGRAGGHGPPGVPGRRRRLPGHVPQRQRHRPAESAAATRHRGDRRHRGKQATTVGLFGIFLLRWHGGFHNR